MSSLVETLDSITFSNIVDHSSRFSCSQYSLVNDVFSSYLGEGGPTRTSVDFCNFSLNFSAVFETLKLDIAIYPAISSSIFLRISGSPSSEESSFMACLCFLNTYSMVSIRSYKLKRALSLDNYIIYV